MFYHNILTVKVKIFFSKDEEKKGFENTIKCITINLFKNQSRQETINNRKIELPFKNGKIDFKASQQVLENINTIIKIFKNNKLHTYLQHHNVT